MQYKTKGIVLRRRNFGEADRLLTIYSEKRGKIFAVAKGVRKIKSKMAGHLELFCLTDFVIAEGKNIDTITSAQMIENFDFLRNDLKLLNKIYYISEVTDKLVHHNEPHEDIYRLLIEILDFLNRDSSTLVGMTTGLTTPYFNIKILKYLGHAPELYTCAHCHEALKPENNFFSCEFGGIICENCKTNDYKAKKIDTNSIKVLRILLESDILVASRIKISNGYINNFTSDFLEHVLEAEVKSKKFL